MAPSSGLWWWEKIGNVPPARRAKITWLIVAVSFFISVFLIGGLSQSKIGLVDENDLPQYVGVSGHVALDQIPQLLVEKTEVGQFGQSPRYRPVFYSIRLMETALWGLEGGYWYTWRILMFGAVIAAMFWLYTQLTGLVMGTISTVFTLSFAMWVDIWTRSTGVSEQYAALGLSIFAVSLWALIQRWPGVLSLRPPVLGIAVGAILAMGSKENMLILELPLLVILALGMRVRRLDPLSVFALVVALLVGCWIASSLVLYFLSSKVQDIYGNSVRSSLLTAKWMVAIYIAAGFAATTILFFDRKLSGKDKENKRRLYRMSVARYVGYALIIAFVFVFNFVFYTGHIPSGIRYDFPALLALPAILIVFLRSMERTCDVFDVSTPAERALGFVLAVGIAIYTSVATWALPAAVRLNVQQTSSFDAGLRETQKITRAHPDWPIFVQSFSYLDYEPIQALGFFLIARAVNNPRYLVYERNPYIEQRSIFQNQLEDALVSQSRNGMADRGYLPFTQVKNTGCYVIVMRKPSQLAIDKANGKDSIADLNCATLPLLMYWEGNKLVFEAP